MKNGNCFKLTLLAVVFGSLIGAKARAQDKLTPHREDRSQVPYRLFRAEGIHTCWSTTSIGHKCRVDGLQFTDCNQAYFVLKRQDCCPRTPEKGSSVAFQLTKCTWH